MNNLKIYTIGHSLLLKKKIREQAIMSLCQCGIQGFQYVGEVNFIDVYMHTFI